MKTNYIIAITVALVILILLVAFRNKLSGLFKTGNTPVGTGTGTGTQTTVVQGANGQPVVITHTPGLNGDKMLYRGITGAEVAQLQQLLGVTTDGDFGPATEAALLNQKCRVAITLNTFSTLTCGNAYGDGSTDDNSHWYDSIPYAGQFFN